MQKKQEYFGKDERGFVYQNGKLSFNPNEKFLQRLEDLINVYEKISEKPIGFEQPEIVKPNSENENQKDKKVTVEFQSQRRKVITLMLLTFGRLDAPEDLTQERIVKFFHGFTGGDIKRLRGFIKNPTGHKGTDRSIKLLCDDLNSVRDELGKLGTNKNVQSIISEIQFLIDDLNETDNFD